MTEQSSKSDHYPYGPCQAVCQYDDNDICVGCFRRREDINNWYFLDDAQKWKIIREVEPRILASRNQHKREEK